MNSLYQRWDRFWFEPQSPATLGFCRLLVLLGAFGLYANLDVRAWGFLPSSFWQPIPLLQHLHLHPYTPGLMWSAGMLWKLSMLLAAIGLFTRLSCAVSFVLGIYLLGLSNSVGKIWHPDAIVLWSFLAFALARSGDAWSLDALLRDALGKPHPLGFKPAPVLRPRTPEPHAEYRWPVRLMQLILVMIFCLSGISKLRQSGLAWALSDNFRYTLVAQNFLAQPPLHLGMYLVSHPQLCRAMSLYALFLELSAPLALLSYRHARVLIPALLALQIGNEVLLGVTFHTFLLCYAFWVPWVTVGNWIRQQTSSLEKTVIFFDGSCGLCTRTMHVIRRLDLLGRVRIMDVTNDWPTVLASYPQLDQAFCLQTMHVISRQNQISTGFLAYRSLCKVIPLGWLMLPFLYIVGVPTVGEIVYRKVAENRFNHGCALPITE
jgi:predicted DCC family thiol-disulfide oxidoreductase YuxK